MYTNLKTVVLPLEQTPSDGLTDPAPLVGESLAVVRYRGEPVTSKHLGPAVVFAPDERGIALRNYEMSLDHTSAASKAAYYDGSFDTPKTKGRRNRFSPSGLCGRISVTIRQQPRRLTQ